MNTKLIHNAAGDGEDRHRGAVKAIVGAIIAMTVLFAALTASVNPASADDDARFLRIGMDKSAVINLPHAAKDVLIGNPDIVDAVVRTQSTAYLFAKKTGQTNVFFFDAAGRQILHLDVEVAWDMKALKKLLDRTMPGNAITVDTINDNVVLSGVAAGAGEAKQAYDLAVKFTGDEKKVVSTLAVTGKEQVMLRVRVAELQRDVLKQLGVDTRQMFAVGKFNVDLLTINPFTVATSGTLSDSRYRGTYTDGSTSIDTVVRAMERDGLMRTLAEPTLTAISGESAKFLAGGEFPVPVGQDDGKISVEFKPFGVGLGFTPVVLSEGNISLRISTEVSELTTENAILISELQIPALKVRRAETTVELPSGGSMVLAGLIQESTRQQINGVPGMKSLPILGTLFRSRDFMANQTELTVIVTPFVVNAVNDKQLVTPIDNLSVATDRQTILFGRLNKVYGVQGGGKGGTYHGNVGFIIE